MEKLKNILLLALFTTLTLYGASFQPLYKLEASGLVNDIILEGDTLYAATQKGSVDIFDIRSKKMTGAITLPDIRDSVGEAIAPKIYSVDRFEGRTLVASEGKEGFRNLFMHDGTTLTKIIGVDKKLFIKEARFVDRERILFGLLSNEIILYSLSKAKELYRLQVSKSAFSDLALDEKRLKVVTADESGIVHVFNIDDGKLLQTYEGQNLDNVYKIDYKRGVVITAGQDRRCAVYREDAKGFYLSSSFLIYAAGLSPSGKTGVFASGLDNELQLFDTRTKSKKALLKGHSASLTAFAFVNEKEFFSSAEEKNILFWSLK